MSGYAVSARIDQGRLRVVATFLLAADADPDAATDRGRVPAAPGAPGFAADLADTAVHDDLIDRIEALRERWSQLTFYLFDADGWR